MADQLSTDLMPFAMVPEELIALVSGNALKVWCLLHRMAGEKSVAWPSIKTIAKRTSLSENTAREATKELKTKAGYRFKIKPRVRDDGGQSSNQYVLSFGRPPAKSAEGLFKDQQGPSAKT